MGVASGCGEQEAVVASRIHVVKGNLYNPLFCLWLI